MRLQIVRTADPGIRHDSGTTSRFVSGRGVAICTPATPHRAVKRMVGAKLVPHLMGYIVDVITIANRIGEPRDPVRLATTNTDHPQTSDASPASAEHVPDVVIAATNHTVQIGLVLAEHCGAAG